MANSPQAKKRVRQNETRSQENKITRSAMRTAIRRVVDADSAESAEAAVPNAMKRIDKAAKHNVIHDNAAARYKNRVARAVRSK